MRRLLILMGFIACANTGMAQVAGRVDKKTKEFYITRNAQSDYQVFGYQYPNNTTKKMICFSTHTADVADNFYHCPLGSYFDTNLLKEGDRIVLLGLAGNFGKMNFLGANGKKTIFYIAKTTFTVQ